MRPRQTIVSLVALVALSSPAIADDIQTHVTYVCNGEHLFIESCNIRDLSDNSTCMVDHPDHMRPNGFPTVTYETRGTLKKLLPTCQQPSAKSVQRVQDAQKKADEQYNKAVNTPAPSASSAMAGASATDPFGFAGPGQSPEQRAATRCIVSGRSPTLCGENSLGKWFEGAISNGVAMANSLMPGSADTLSKATKPLPPGLEIAGNYMGGGNWRMQFDDRSAMMACGDLDQEQRFYSIGIVSGQAAIKIDITPKPFVLSLRPDGTLADEGPVVVNGRVITGAGSSSTTPGHYVTSESTNTQKLTPMEAQQYSGDPNLHQDGQYYTRTTTTSSTSYQPGQTTYSGPSYAPKTETCTRAILTNSGKTQVDALKGMAEGMLLGESAPPTPPGLRMHGAYVAPSGFSVEFFPESAIVGCGAAVRAYPYSIRASGNDAVVRFETPGRPLTMALKADNSLDPGAGQYEVQGRRIIAQNADGDFVFSPLNQTCTMAVLRPGEIPAPGPALGGAANTLGTGAPNQPAMGNAVLTVKVVASQPGAPNALSGQPLILLRSGFGDAVVRSGMRPQAGMTPLQDWYLACQKKLPQCGQAIAVVRPSLAGMARVDASGNATFAGLSAGQYYVFGTTNAIAPALGWDVRVDLRSGANSLVLDQRNAQTLPVAK